MAHINIPGFYVEPIERKLARIDANEPQIVKLPRTNRIWIIGNGPSLRPEDLEALHKRNEVCIGMNRIQLIYDKTNWRPSIYCLADASRSMSWVQDALFHLKQGYPCHIKTLILNALTPHLDGGLGAWIDQPWNVTPIVECMHNFIDSRPPTKWHPPHPCCFQGSMNAAIQIGAFAGYKNIILLGVDHSWKLREQPFTPDPNHYDPRYDGGLENGPLSGIHIQNGLPFLPLNNGTMEKLIAESIYMYRLNAREAMAREISIVNASRFSNLYTFPRASFEDFLGEG